MQYVSRFHPPVYTMLPAAAAATFQATVGETGRNGVTVSQRRGTVWTNVSRRDSRGRRGNFLTVNKSATAATVQMTYFIDCSKTGLTKRNMTVRNRP